MLRSISRRNVSQHLSTSVAARHRLSCRQHPSFRYARLYSTPTTDPRLSPSEKPSLPPNAPARKQPKLDLRPGPIKTTHLGNASRAAPKLPNVPLTAPINAVKLNLNAAKHEAQRDIEEAEKHGILPPPPEGANWFKATLHKAIELAKFYFRGVKLIFSRRKQIAAIRARIKEGGPPLTRAEFRFIATQKDDVNKVIPFLIIALLLEEVIPLIAIYAPFMLPSTCILPSQRARIESKKAEKALASSVNSKAVFQALKAQAMTAPLTLETLKNVEGAPTAMCSLLGLSTLGVDALRIRRVRKHLEFIAEDDALLLQDAEVKLGEKALVEALGERGLLLSKATSSSSQDALLQQWLAAVKDKSPEEALSARLSLILSRQ